MFSAVRTITLVILFKENKKISQKFHKDYFSLYECSYEHTVYFPMEKNVYSKLSAMFMDFDSYFASVEQYAQPRLRGKPVGVAPVMAESSCCIAASYEAKAYGVKTGTRVSDARELCPGIIIVPARPELYVKVHHAAIEVVEQCIHVEKVLSIDELWAWIPYNWRNPEQLALVTENIKRGMEARFSSDLTCSIGLAPNRWLAKMASKMRKPNGVLMILPDDLPEVLHELDLSDIHGVGRSMELRLHAAGIHSVEALCAASRQKLHSIWGSVEGDRLYLQLRGHHIPDPPTVKRTVGHSHVLPPDRRRPERASAVLHKLTQKAGTRLRSYDMLASALVLSIRYLNGQRWAEEVRMEATSDALVFAKIIANLWRHRPTPREPLLKIAMTLHHLSERENFTPSLFAPAKPNRDKLNVAIDSLQKRFGKKSLHLGCDHDAVDSENMRISFTHIPDLSTEKN